MKKHSDFHPFLVAAVTFLCLAAGIVSGATVTQAITYQGKLTDPAGNPLKGTYTVGFSLYGSSTGGTAFTSITRSIVCTNGLFATQLAFDPQYFDGRALWLGIKVGSDPEMAPRQEIRPVPYALGIRPGSVIRGTATSDTLILLNAGGWSALNVSAPVQYGTGITVPVISRYGTGISMSGDGDDAAGIRASLAGKSATGINLAMSGVYSKGVMVTTSNVISDGIYSETSGDYSKGIYAITAGNHSEGISVHTLGKESPGIVATTGSENSVGIVAGTEGTGSPGVRVITGGSDSPGVRVITGGSGSPGSSVMTGGPVSEGFVASTLGTASDGVKAYTVGTSSTGVYSATAGRDSPGVMIITTNESSDGVLAITTGPASPGVFVSTGGAGSDGIVSVTSSAESDGINVTARGLDSHGITVTARQGVGIETNTYSSNVWYTGGSFRNFGAGNGVYGQSATRYGIVGSTERPDQKYGIYTDDYLYAKGTQVPSTDVAEYMPVSGDAMAGTVLVIGPGGILQLSSVAYDTRVAGIVSTDPGVTLGTNVEGNAGEALIAVAGRVPCRVDASYGPIREGDLLATSDTPGHAMKAEPTMIDGRGFYPDGTILGKAMGTLESGTGTIEVLVTLQ